MVGLLAGLLGIGGGLVIGPMLLDMGINPIISATTSNFLVLFTSSSTTVQFLILGMINIENCFIYGVCSIIGSIIGTIFIQNLIKKTGRTSILVFTLATVLGLSSIFIPIDTIIRIHHMINAGLNLFVISPLCKIL